MDASREEENKTNGKVAKPQDLPRPVLMSACQHCGSPNGTVYHGRFICNTDDCIGNRKHYDAEIGRKLL